MPRASVLGEVRLVNQGLASGFMSSGARQEKRLCHHAGQRATVELNGRMAAPLSRAVRHCVVLSQGPAGQGPRHLVAPSKTEGGTQRGRAWRGSGKTLLLSCLCDCGRAANGAVRPAHWLVV